MITEASITPISSPGRPLPSRMSIGRIGVTSNWSNVPVSRSRATDSPTTSRVTTWVSRATMPGTMNQCELSVGL